MRQSGILLHPTSLPGDFGIGDLGTEAYGFADFLAESGCGLWQILPLGPTGFGHSPYQAYSAMGGNPLLVSLPPLVERGLLAPEDLESPPTFPGERVDFDAVIPWRKRLLDRAARAFFRKGPPDPRFERFCADEGGWLEPFARFAALREANGEAAWTDWDPGVVPDEEAGRVQKFIQFEFFRQWGELRAYCRGRGIRIIGDLPIFVAHDSADVWAHRTLFDLDERGRPLTVAGVPPDYFSATGQLWGNPLYRWEEMERTGYRWWIERVRAALGTADLVRLDHFRGFEKYYEIPGGAADASVGRWVPGPGDRLFEALEAELGSLPFIAEDLGYITPEVLALRDRRGFPGMRVLQFAFGDRSRRNPHKPYNFTRNSVVYTGTHDNDTTAGWFASDRTRGEAEAALRYMGTDGSDGVGDLLRLALGSVADTAVIPMQDILGLGTEARMNTPSTVGGNWCWRMRPDALTPEAAARLREMNRRYGRGGV
ncbi:MAG: 4-alpha-glucanotransferase [Acidobacteria bacterium]|nr:4-alpha-glucanotransferase [Acidobacteriota bacterium]